MSDLLHDPIEHSLGQGEAVPHVLLFPSTLSSDLTVAAKVELKPGGSLSGGGAIIDAVAGSSAHFEDCPMAGSSLGGCQFSLGLKEPLGRNRGQQDRH